VQVGHRHFGRGDEIEVVTADLVLRLPVRVLGDAEGVLGELRQLAGAAHGVVLDDHRRPDLGVAVLVDVGVEHELHQAALEARAHALEHDEARAADLDSAVEVEDVEADAEVHVILGRELEVRNLPDHAPDHVGVLVEPLGHVVRGQVGQVEHQVLELRLDGHALGLEALGLVAQRAQGLAPRLELARALVGLGHGLGGLVALGALLLDGDDGVLAPLRQGSDRVEHVGVGESAPRESGSDFVEVLGDESKI